MPVPRALISVAVAISVAVVIPIPMIAAVLAALVTVPFFRAGLLGDVKCRLRFGVVLDGMQWRSREQQPRFQPLN